MTSTIGQGSNSCLLATLTQEKQVLAYRSLDLADTGCPWLAKELSFLAVGAHPELCGSPWRLAAEFTDGETTPQLRLEARSTDPWGPLLATESIPLKNLMWIGAEMARQMGIKPENFGKYTFHVTVIGRDHQTMNQANGFWEDDEFAMLPSAPRELRLPSEFSTEPLGPRRILRECPGAGSRTRCVFTAAAWQQFVAVAEQETEVERGFAAPMRVHLVDGRCYLAVGDPLEELPAEAGPSYLITHGRYLFQLHRRYGGKFAYLHLHPREIDGVAVTPHPSGPDVTVAWNLDACTVLPVCMPIALLGMRPDPARGEVAVHSFVNGLLKEITLEVLGGTR